MIRRYPVFGLLLGCAVLACAGPEPTAPTTTNSSDNADDAFETASLRVGAVKVRNVEVPAGYTLTDMNRRGDLLLGTSWLRKGSKQPEPLPFAGRFINDDRQILGPGLAVFNSGVAGELPNPCVAGGSYSCSRGFQGAAQAANGDVVGSYQLDAPGTSFDPIRSMAVWRAASEQWQTLESGYRWSYQHMDISDGGWVAADFYTFGPRVSRVYPPPGTAGGRPISPIGACTPPYADALDVFVRVVNDQGEAAGMVLCRTATGGTSLYVRWPSVGDPVVLASSSSTLNDIDNFGNVAGVTGGRATVWLSDGTAVDLSAAVGGQASSAIKFLKEGQVFGFVGAQAVIWRFGF